MSIEGEGKREIRLPFWWTDHGVRGQMVASTPNTRKTGLEPSSKNGKWKVARLDGNEILNRTVHEEVRHSLHGL